MKIEKVIEKDKELWKDFVRENCPTVGGFMQSWEWGEFQEARGRTIDRFFVVDGSEKVAAFTIVHYSLPLGMKYGYSPRGPVIALSSEDKFIEICEVIRQWALKELSHLLFLRIEPALSCVPPGLIGENFKIPSYYIQPKHNHVVSLGKSEEEILNSFHASTRSNVRRAEKRGVTTQIKDKVTPDEYINFIEMMKDTCARNSDKNLYPSDEYFKSLFLVLSEDHSLDGKHRRLELSAFYGFCNGEPAATYFVLFFGDTATYLYGGSHAKYLSSKVTTYLHFEAMKEAKRRGMRFYDLGGIDPVRWPTLTDFKRQFKGIEYSYIGNIDIPLRPFLYKIYNIVRFFKK